jgi:hypothetical protein
MVLGMESRPAFSHILAVFTVRRSGIMAAMTEDRVKEILDRVLTWPREDQEKVARFAERRRSSPDRPSSRG